MPRSPRKNQWWRAVKKCGGRCWYCGLEPEELTVDHAKPRSRGGQNFDDNLLPACAYCNNEKANLTVSEYRKFLKVKAIRKLMELGYFSCDLSQVRIIFFGEGNSSPFIFSEFQYCNRSSETWKLKFALDLAVWRNRLQNFMTVIKAKLCTSSPSVNSAVLTTPKNFAPDLKTSSAGQDTPTTQIPVANTVSNLNNIN